MSVNKVILIGNVGKDPQVRYIAENKPYASFPLATSDPAYTTEAGVQIPERTEWHNIVMWARTPNMRKSISARARNSTSRANSAPACGRTATR